MQFESSLSENTYSAVTLADNDSLTTSRILIADDSTIMRTIIASHLRRSGFENLSFANDGVEALQSAQASVPDLVITDLAMPNMDGFDLCRALRSDPRTADVPILIQTGSEFKEDRTRSFANGASDLVTKPIEGQELIARVRVHLERRALISRLTEYQRRMAEELTLARVMQESLLPEPAEIARIEHQLPIMLSSCYEPSLGLGGDIWGMTPVGARSIRLFSADFTGHGVGSALNTFRLHSFITSGAANAIEPGAWLAQLNEFMCGALPVGQFATMFAAIVDLDRHEIRYSAASAPPPLLRTGAFGAYQQIDGTGFPIGITRKATYETKRLDFPSGSTLVLYSDALIETPEPPNAVFTTEKLCDFLNGLEQGHDAKAAQEALVAALGNKAGEKPTDDLTIIALHHRAADAAIARNVNDKASKARSNEGEHESIDSECQTFATDPKTGMTHLINGRFEIQTHDQAEQLSTLLAGHCPDPERVAPGLWELLSNAIEHGNLAISFEEKTELLRYGTFEQEVKRRLQQDPYKKRIVIVTFDQIDSDIRIVITDEGDGFNYDEAMKRELSLDLPNGRGIAIATTISFDTLAYKGKGNSVEATLKIAQS